MSEDYGMPYQRKSKRGMLRKRKQRVYKRGGTFRGVVFKPNESESEKQKRNQKK